ncbi:hypothetical protein [Indiicoccus explosivorum]|uniref:hypothetical protein n=1 Tax=Indiicoccus explosivorum TaxID=1917864 RepID=UPI000B441A90|nr:hypothetical protein [Indiicoccus explosivorum]
MINLLFIVLYATIMGLVIEIAVLLFRATGLEKEVARFQAISMLTGTGYTTDESALVIDHPIRRRISAVMILFGYFSLAVIISSIASLLSNDMRIGALSVGIAVLFTILIVFRSKRMMRVLQKRFEHDMDAQFNLEDWPLKEILALGEGDAVMVVDIEEGSKYEGFPCRKLIEGEEYMNLLFIERGDHVVRKSLWEEKLRAGDKVMVFGDESAIRRKFEGALSEHLIRQSSAINP